MQIIVGAQIKPLHPVGYLAFGGQHQHRDSHSLPAQLPKNRKPIFFREHDVEYDQIIGVGKDFFQGESTITGCIYGVLLLPENYRNLLAQFRLVIHDQHPHTLSPLFLLFTELVTLPFYILHIDEETMKTAQGKALFTISSSGLW
jgi:hypothetical protein